MGEEKIVDPVLLTEEAKRIGFDKERHSNASSILFDNLELNPDKNAVIGSEGVWTYRELCEQACRWGNAFISCGLKRGDRIAFFLDDTPVYPAAFFGAVRAGFVPVLLNTHTTEDLLNYFLQDTGAELALCEADFMEKFNDATMDGTRLRTIIITNSENVPAKGFLPDQQFLEGQPCSLPCVDTGPDDMAFWMYSSGSTGRPKGIVHLQHDMAYTAQSFGAHILKLDPDDICFSVPKIFFAYGFGNSFTFPFSIGATTLLMSGHPRADRVLDTIENFKPTVLFGLPTLYTALCRQNGVDQRDLSSLRLCLSAAETLSEEIFNQWKSLTGLEAVEGLGSTELLHIYLSNSQQDKRLGSAGAVVPGYEVVLKNQDGKVVEPGREGIMWVRGDSSLPLYWNRPENTAETIRGDWVYTGDRFIEKDGYYYIQGRADDLIKVSGQWVWPLEVERCLAEHPDINECAVLAHQMTDKRMTLRAIISLNPGVSANAEKTAELQEFVRGNLLPFKYPRIVEYIDELPKTGTGKIDRQTLGSTSTQ